MKYWKEAEELIPKTVSLALATINEDGSPQVAPIGSLFLTGEGRGIYFEKLPQVTRGNLDRDKRFSILACRGSMFFWMKSFFLGKFNKFPALRLSGKAGERRPCTPEEKKLFDGKFDSYKCMKAYNILWKDMNTVRDLHFDQVEPINIRSMTKGLL
ncbi:pyridoxamine 5'-phosphate oxidase family protein [Pseudodesulfovibrio sp.]|nr:pyridoxamine 5'-phosphate oxidase family protein [Pseudodesulfovibrio sp.]